jgi:hypothetical protein
LSADFDVACGQFRITRSFWSSGYGSGNGDYPFRPQFPSLGVHLGTRGRVKHHLRYAITVSQVNKHQSAVVAV